MQLPDIPGLKQYLQRRLSNMYVPRHLIHRIPPHGTTPF